MKKKIALIFGGSGQDGTFLSYILLKKNYKVICVSRRKKKINNHKILNIHKKIFIKNINFYKQEAIKKLIINSKCQEIYFLSGLSRPVMSFKKKNQTLKSNILPVYYLLETVRKLNKNIKVYNSSSCEIFKQSKKKLNEKSEKKPNNPYGLSKLISYNLVKFYRQKYNVKCFSCILFQHESILRNNNYLIPKIISSAKKIKKGIQKKIELGNINISKDWGWAPEYVNLIYKLMQQKVFDDYVIGTGRKTSIKYILQKVFSKFNLTWKKYLVINKKYFRQKDIKISYADASKINKKLNWKPRYFIDEIIDKLINKEIF